MYILPTLGSRGHSQIKDNVAERPGESAYTIRRGDTLSSIAKAHGVSMDALRQANPKLLNPDCIYPGDRILLPSSHPDKYKDQPALNKENFISPVVFAKPLPEKIMKLIEGFAAGSASVNSSTQATPGASAGEPATVSFDKVATPTAKLTDDDYKRAARLLGDGVDYRLLKAFAFVESGGKSGFGPDGLPKIAFEGHLFRKLTGRAYDTTHPTLSYPYRMKAGPEWQTNNKNQQTAWETLRGAMLLDRDAAIKATSFGKFQVVGLYSGQKNMDQFLEKMKTESGQLSVFVDYIKSKPQLVQALQDKNFVQMALHYNGKDYGNYDKQIEKAYRNYCSA